MNQTWRTTSILMTVAAGFIAQPARRRVDPRADEGGAGAAPTRTAARARRPRRERRRSARRAGRSRAGRDRRSGTARRTLQPRHGHAAAQGVRGRQASAGRAGGFLAMQGLRELTDTSSCRPPSQRQRLLTSVVSGPQHDPAAADQPHAAPGVRRPADPRRGDARGQHDGVLGRDAGQLCSPPPGRRGGRRHARQGGRRVAQRQGGHREADGRRQRRRAGVEVGGAGRAGDQGQVHPMADDYRRIAIDPAKADGSAADEDRRRGDQGPRGVRQRRERHPGGGEESHRQAPARQGRPRRGARRSRPSSAARGSSRRRTRTRCTRRSTSRPSATWTQRRAAPARAGRPRRVAEAEHPGRGRPQGRRGRGRHAATASTRPRPR